MAQNIKEILQEALLKALSSDAEKALTANEIYSKIKQDQPDFEINAGTFKNYISRMSQDPTSIIAKKDGSQGYFLRTITETTHDERAVTDSFKESEKSRDSQLEEKFRAIYMRYAESNGLFPIHIEHTKAKKERGVRNLWRYPDVVSLGWSEELLNASDDGVLEIELNQALLNVKRSLGEMPFRLTSVELKAKTDLTNLREYFFQCVSNSKWAHYAQLAIAEKISDGKILDQLRRLGASYDITILEYGFSENDLKTYANANEILDMPLETFMERIGNTINITTIHQSRGRETLDWEHLSDMRQLLDVFTDMFEWINKCLLSQKRIPFRKFVENRDYM